MPQPSILATEFCSRRTPPANLTDSDRSLFEQEFERNFPASTVKQLSGVSVYPHGILSKGTRALEESFPSGNPVDKWNKPAQRAKLLLNQVLRAKAPKTKGPHAWITDSWSHNYFHWMTESLPRLWSLGDQISEVCLALPGHFKDLSFVSASLEIFHPRDVEFVQSITRFPELVYPPRISPTGNYIDPVIRELRDRFLAHFHKDQSERPPSKRVYISRAHARMRKIENEEECESVLKKFGFETYHFENLDLQEQVNICANAKLLVSNHGAGMTNLLYMQSGGKVLELRDRDAWDNNCYFTLASALQLDFYYQFCKRQDIHTTSHDGNIIVNCEQLRENLLEMTSSEN